jgi:hypothetical protein
MRILAHQMPSNRASKIPTRTISSLLRKFVEVRASDVRKVARLAAPRRQYHFRRRTRLALPTWVENAAMSLRVPSWLRV